MQQFHCESYKEMVEALQNIKDKLKIKNKTNRKLIISHISYSYNSIDFDYYACFDLIELIMINFQ